jgi:hypothetical protein
MEVFGLNNTSMVRNRPARGIRGRNITYRFSLKMALF